MNMKHNATEDDDATMEAKTQRIQEFGVAVEANIPDNMGFVLIIEDRESDAGGMIISDFHGDPVATLAQSAAALAQIRDKNPDEFPDPVADMMMNNAHEAG